MPIWTILWASEQEPIALAWKGGAGTARTYLIVVLPVVPSMIDQRRIRVGAARKEASREALRKFGETLGTPDPLTGVLFAQIARIVVCLRHLETTTTSMQGYMKAEPTFAFGRRLWRLVRCSAAMPR